MIPPTCRLGPSTPVYHSPALQLCLFAEGSRFTEEKHAASVEYCKTNGLPVLKHHLFPRTKGFALLAKHMKGVGEWSHMGSCDQWSRPHGGRVCCSVDAGRTNHACCAPGAAAALNSVSVPPVIFSQVASVHCSHSHFIMLISLPLQYSDPTSTSIPCSHS